MTKKFLALSGAMAALALIAACQPAAKEEPAPAAEAAAPAPAPAPAVVDIVDTAVGAGQFTSLVAAVQAAGLAETLKGPGPFTVFAPNDAAFAKLPPEELKKLLAPEGKEALTKILTYHVVPGKIVSADLAGKVTDAATVEGKTVKVDATGAGVKVGEATVVTADIEASNGVIHVIDTVLMPPK